jgi:hypothetical protein
MYRRIRHAAILLLTLALPTAIAAGDEVAAWLEGQGLTALLAVHLEQQLQRADEEERGELLIRLAALYAQLLETADDPEQRADLEERSRRLLADSPSRDTDKLRLALLRTSYRSAERIAEDYRLRQCTDDELQRAKETLAELIGQFNRLRAELEDRARLIERRLARSAGSDAVVLGEEAEQARQLYSQCTFLTAWTLYYHSWLTDQPDEARRAQRLFAELLGFRDEPAVPEDVSVDLRSVESIARCILGMALCRSMTASSASALGWVALLEHERAYGPLHEQVPAWMIAIRLEHGEYLAVRGMLDQLTAEGRTTPLHWLRLVVVHALEAEQRYRPAAELARYAVTELAARGELEQVFDLAERYGVDALGAEGFAPRYVRGVLTYREARQAHGADEPTTEATIAALYDEAIAAFEAARVEPDAAGYTSALPDCTRLIGWCLYFQGRLTEARDAFEQAAAVLPAREAPEALWMAIVCMDRLAAARPGSAALANRLATLVERFLAEYPSSVHAPKLILRRALTSGEVSAQVADELLSIPENSEVYGAAQRRAAEVLYQLFRQASLAQRIAWGEKYLSVAAALYERDAENLQSPDALALPRFLVTGRRILEVALYEGIGELDAARSVLATIDELGQREDLDLEDIEGEIAYRRVLERLLSGDPDEAGLLADRLWEQAPEGVWARLAGRAMFKYGNRRWREATDQGADDRAAVAMVVRYGQRVLAEYEGDATAVNDPSVLSFFAAVADASMTIWQRSGDRERGELALSLYERLLQVRPRNARFLRSTAVLSEAFDKDERAIECWRTLLAGTAQATDAWYEAKFSLISLLAKVDPVRARAVMDQHKQLNPDYGPDPWGPRLQNLDWRLAPDPDEPGAVEGEEGPPPPPTRGRAEDDA